MNWTKSRKTLNKTLNDMKTERYWEITASGPVAVQMNPDELRASSSWVCFHNYNGRLIFENYSRAILCFFEMMDAGMIDKNFCHV